MAKGQLSDKGSQKKAAKTIMPKQKKEVKKEVKKPVTKKK